MADDTETFDQDFKHWVEAVGSAGNKQAFDTGRGRTRDPSAAPPRALSPWGRTPSGTPGVCKDMERGASAGRGSAGKGTEILSEPVSPSVRPLGSPLATALFRCPLSTWTGDENRRVTETHRSACLLQLQGL